MTDFEKKVAALRAHHEELLSKKNQPLEWGNGIYEKYANPILAPAASKSATAPKPTIVIISPIAPKTIIRMPTTLSIVEPFAIF